MRIVVSRPIIRPRYSFAGIRRDCSIRTGVLEKIDVKIVRVDRENETPNRKRV